MNVEQFPRKGAWVVLAIALGLVACSSDHGADAVAGGTSNGAAGTHSSAGSSGVSAGGGDHAGSGGSSSGSGGALASDGGSAFGGAFGGGPSEQGGASADAGRGAGGASSAAGAAGTSGAGGTTATAGASGTAGAGGPNAYDPCPRNGTPCKILPFGDSITRGAKSSDDAGYRSQLFKLIVAGNQKVTFTGSLTNGPTQVSGQTFPRMHEGHPGWTIDPGFNTMGNYGGISSLVPSPALAGTPNIILLQIGTNDLFAKGVADMSTRLEALLDKIAQNAPSALIVLAQITPLGTPNAGLTAYNAKIPGIIQSHAAKGQHIIGVDMSKLPIDQLSDGTHPNDRGYATMAGIWYAAIKDLLPK